MEVKHLVIIYLCIELIKFIAAKVLNQQEHLEILREISENNKKANELQANAAKTLAHIATFRCPYIDDCHSDKKEGLV
jgi:hypothetical protein